MNLYRISRTLHRENCVCVRRRARCNAGHRGKWPRPAVLPRLPGQWKCGILGSRCVASVSAARQSTLVVAVKARNMSIYETPAITPSAPVADDQQAPKLALQDQDGSACPTDIVIPDYIADVGTGGLHVRQSSRVMSSAKPPHDDNLLATAETGETASPASDESALSTRIAAFKHARAQRKQRALAVLLNLSLVVLVVALGVGYWTSFTSNTEISYTELRPDGTLIQVAPPQLSSSWHHSQRQTQPPSVERVPVAALVAAAGAE